MSVSHRLLERRLMRILAFILSIVIATGLCVGAAFLLATQSRNDDSLSIFTAAPAMMIFVFGPLTVGSFRAYWDVTGSQDSRRYYGRILLVVIGLEVLAAIALVVSAALTSAGPFIPVVFVGAGVILTTVALLLGPVLYRLDLAHPASTPRWVAIEKAEITKRIAASAISFLGVLIVGIIVLGIVGALAPNAVSVTQTLLLALSLAFIVSGAVCVFPTLGWNRLLRDLIDRDPARLRQVARVVIRNKHVDLDEQDLEAAARYAAMLSVTMPFQLGSIVLLYVGIALQQINALQNPATANFSVWIIVLLIVALAFLLPLQVVHIRRVRRYARDHAADSSNPPGPAQMRDHG